MTVETTVLGRNRFYEADVGVAAAKACFVRFAVIQQVDGCAIAANGRFDGPRRGIKVGWSKFGLGRFLVDAVSKGAAQPN